MLLSFYQGLGVSNVTLKLLKSDDQLLSQIAYVNLSARVNTFIQILKCNSYLQPLYTGVPLHFINNVLCGPLYLFDKSTLELLCRLRF